MLNMSFRAKFIINPAAGANRALARWARFEAQLRRHGIEADKAFTTGQGDATLQARKAALDYDLLVAVGGDGTVSEVADGILSCPGSQAALGLLPFGTGNDVAEVLGIQIHTDALRCLIVGQTKYIDAIQVHCQSDGVSVIRHSLLFAGVGIISESLKKTTARVQKVIRPTNGLPGWFSASTMELPIPTYASHLRWENFRGTLPVCRRQQYPDCRRWDENCPERRSR